MVGRARALRGSSPLSRTPCTDPHPSEEIRRVRYATSPKDRLVTRPQA